MIVNKVQRNELLPFAEYEQIRPHFRGRMIEQKRRRRIALGEHMSMVFENHDSALLQVQEMLRTERITDEKAIAHELSTYNELVPPPGGVSGTLFIEYDDKPERSRMLASFSTLRDSVFLVIGSHKTRASFSTHFGEELDRLPAVNYLTFVVGKEHAPSLLDDKVPAAIEITHPEYRITVPLARELREELAHDLET
jgi:hypothetical protein